MNNNIHVWWSVSPYVCSVVGLVAVNLNGIAFFVVNHDSVYFTYIKQGKQSKLLQGLVFSRNR